MRVPCGVWPVRRVASRRARPTWPPLTEAAHLASFSDMPSLSISTLAIAASGGVTNARCRQRDRNVIEMSSGSTDGAHSRKHRRRRRFLNHLQ